MYRFQHEIAIAPRPSCTEVAKCDGGFVSISTLKTIIIGVHTRSEEHYPHKFKVQVEKLMDAARTKCTLHVHNANCKQLIV
jgi:hypothetical protein